MKQYCCFRNFPSFSGLPGSVIFFIVARTAGTVAIKRRCLSRNANKVRPFVIDKGLADLKDNAVQRAAWAVDIGSPHTTCGLSPPAVADASAPDISPAFRRVLPRFQKPDLGIGGATVTSAAASFPGSSSSATDKARDVRYPPPPQSGGSSSMTCMAVARRMVPDETW